jgi:NAD(P)-dependent dehydrogenase (short-subunit alcohol dehydrogenase family)
LVNVFEIWSKFFLPYERVSTHDKAVLITGCASGFGAKLATKLDAAGFKVYAGVKQFDERSKKLTSRCSNQLTLLELDIQNHEHVLSAVRSIKNSLGQRRLWAIVSNAGYCNISPFEWVDETNVQQLAKTLDVNVLGPARLAKAFAPLLRNREKSESRLIFVSSACGKYQLPCASYYSASKAALSAFAASIRRELRPFNISVVTIEPTIFTSPMTSDDALLGKLQRSWSTCSSDIKAAYEENEVGLEHFQTALALQLLTRSEDSAPVIDCLFNAVVSKRKPSEEITVAGLISSLGLSTLFTLPSQLKDMILLNHVVVRAIHALGFKLN